MWSEAQSASRVPWPLGSCGPVFPRKQGRGPRGAALGERLSFLAIFQTMGHVEPWTSRVERGREGRNLGTGGAPKTEGRGTNTVLCI